MNFLNKLLAPFETTLKKNIESYVRLETADDESTLVASDGSLLTYLKIEGSRQIIGDAEYKHLIESATLKLGARFDRAGHALQVFFIRDKERVEQSLDVLLRPSRMSAQAMNLDVMDLLEERKRHLSKFISYEESYFVLWTRPSVLTKTEISRAAKEAKEKKWVAAGYAQNPLAALDALRTRHRSYVSAIVSALDELDIKALKLDSHDALIAVKNNLFPERAGEDWRPCLPGDPIRPRAPTVRGDLSEILWPSLKQQLAAADAFVVDDSIVKIGNQLFGGADMVLGPMEATAFPVLLNRLVEAGVPHRISFLIEGGGASAISLKASVATMLSVTNAVNKQIKYSLEGLQRVARSEPVAKLRITIATWAPANNLKLMQDRLSVIVQSLESWGYCQASEFSGDPLDCVMSSAMGLHCSSTAPTAIAPLYEIMKMLPWQRPSSPFTQGAMLFRTPDGKVWPYQTGTSLTTTWFDLIFAQPGAGKSVMMNTLNLGTCLQAGLSKLPFIAVVDIGPSSSGLISLIKEALPPGRTHEAAYFRLQMSHKYAINPFDTQLGCRYPLPEERSYLIELLTLLCTPPGYERPYDGMQQLAGFVIDEMYRWRDDNSANAEARPYLPRLDAEIDEALQKHNIHLPADPLWWDVVEKMYDLGEYHIAVLAQRHAVPTLGDTITASRRPQIRTLMEETSVGSGSETVISAFERMVTSAIREYPILSSVTQFDVSNARICSLDLMDVCPQGDETADRQSSIMYMLARHVLVRGWWMGEESLAHIPEKYRPFHELKLQDTKETPKRLCYDEFHRTGKSISVRSQVIRDVREGRKRGVQIVLASQLLEDFDDDMIDLATGIWVMGAAISDQAVDNIQTRFGLSATARSVIRHRLTGPRSTGAPCLLVLATNEGRYEQHLINTLGPIELWAMSTSSEDVTIRTRLYNTLGAGAARQLLAANFPGGSARSEIKRRVLMRAEKARGGDMDKSGAQSEVINEIVNELIEAAKSKLDKSEIHE
ncbi:MAG: type IV secretion protein IcmB [Rhodospirillales bacterium]|nr:type IV secretion protein IcmB [Rhodospirillales bacterium]MCB9965641.1 type IV secretion protein IcmB [Rhodospirillales bacterium]MCB9973065.1 type IV secretion protein IcmB [Rhodospirillales bacterium]